MKTAELAAELRSALANLTRGHADELVGCGVPWSVIIDLMIGVERVSATQTGCYCPDPNGGTAYITPVRAQYADTPQSTAPWRSVRGGYLFDLLAWNVKAPECWALRSGAATWLGCVPVQDYPELVTPAPTRLRRTPFHWMRSDCTGLVALSPERADRYRLYGELHGGIIAEDDDHRREVLDILERPWPAPPVWTASEANSTD